MLEVCKEQCADGCMKITIMSTKPNCNLQNLFQKHLKSQTNLLEISPYSNYGNPQSWKKYTCGNCKKKNLNKTDVFRNENMEKCHNIINILIMSL